MIKTLLAVIIGSSFGGVLRWYLTQRFNPFFLLPYGTLLSNLIAAYIIGFSLMLFNQSSVLSNEWKLFIMTGFCGGLSTFSSFSLDVVLLMQKQQWLLAIYNIILNVIGSILMTLLGIASYKLIKVIFN